jgi:RimJ/RimL family protein N-acetyltransferase
MIIRRSTESDIVLIGEIYSAAKVYMQNNGNPTQWSKNGPDEESARRDIDRGIGYVCEDFGEIVAVFAFEIGREPCYDKIYDGNWLTSEPYAYIHRVAVKKHGQGIIDFCFDECFKMHPNLRIDTHKDNIPMQKVLKRCGFKECGVILLENGEKRLAFQKI